MSYTPGQTLESYLAEQQAGFTPQHVAAVYDIPTESNNYSYGQDAYDTTLDTAAAERDWTMARNAAREPIVSEPGYGFQDFYGEGSRKTGSNWAELANIIGFKGPLYETTGYTYDPGTEIQGEVTGGRTQEGYTPTSGASYELKQALSDYAIVPKNDRGAPAVDIYDKSGKLVASQRLDEPPSFFDQAFPAILGALATGGIGMGAAGLMGLTAGSIGAGAAAGAIGGGLNSALQGGNVLKGILTGGLTGGVGAAAAPVINTAGSAASNAVGGGTFGNIASNAVTGAARSGLSAAMTGKSVGDALITGGLGGAATSGANALVGGTANTLGIPPAVMKILGPTAVAALLGKDPTGAALNATIGQLTAAMKAGVTGGGAPASTGAASTTGAAPTGNLPETVARTAPGVSELTTSGATPAELTDDIQRAAADVTMPGLDVLNVAAPATTDAIAGTSSGMPGLSAMDSLEGPPPNTGLPSSVSPLSDSAIQSILANKIQELDKQNSDKGITLSFSDRSKQLDDVIAADPYLSKLFPSNTSNTGSAAAGNAAAGNAAGDDTAVAGGLPSNQVRVEKITILKDGR